MGLTTLAVAAQAATSAAQATAESPGFDRLPVPFYEREDAPAGVTVFQADSLDGSVLFSPGGLLLRTAQGELGVAFEDALTGTSLEADVARSSIMNVIVGDDRALDVHRTGYAAITYRGIYPGVDLRYEGYLSGLKGTWLLEPGVDPAVIGWSYRDAELALLDEGRLGITTDLGELREDRPVAWQDIDGVRTPVEVAYALDGGTVGFEVGAYDPTQPLVIDPILEWASMIGGDGTDAATGIASDGAGAIYLTGYIHSNDYAFCSSFPTSTACVPWLLVAPTGSAPFQDVYGGEIGDAFVTKIDVSTTPATVLYSTRLGGGGSYYPACCCPGWPCTTTCGTPCPTTSTDHGTAIQADALGNAYLCGVTSSDDFPEVNAIAYPAGTVSLGQFHGFVAKLDPNGLPIYSTYIALAGSSVDCADIDIDSSGTAYIVGSVSTPGIFTQAYLGSLDVDPATGLVGITGNVTVGGLPFLNGNTVSTAVHVDAQDDVYVIGTTQATDFASAGPIIAGPNVPMQTGATGSPSPSILSLNLLTREFVLNIGDGFIERYDATLTTRSFASYLNSVAGTDEIPLDIKTDGSTIYMCGTFNLFAPGAEQWDAYLTTLTLDPTGTVYAPASTPFGGFGVEDVARALAIEGSRLYIGGTTGECFGGVNCPLGPFTNSFPVWNGIAQPTVPSACSTNAPGFYDGNAFGGFYDGFIVRADLVTGDIWSTYVGGPTAEVVADIAVTGPDVFFCGEVVVNPGFLPLMHQSLCAPYWGITPTTLYDGSRHSGGSGDVLVGRIID